MQTHYVQMRRTEKTQTSLCYEDAWAQISSEETMTKKKKQNKKLPEKSRRKLRM